MGLVIGKTNYDYVQRATKIGCPLVYKEYKLHNVSLMTPRQLQHHKDRVFKELRSSITSDRRKVVLWFLYAPVPSLGGKLPVDHYCQCTETS